MSSKRSSSSSTSGTLNTPNLSNATSSSVSTNSINRISNTTPSSSTSHNLRSSTKSTATSSRSNSTNEVPPSSKQSSNEQQQHADLPISADSAVNIFEPTNETPTINDANKKKLTDSLYQRLKKRTISGVLNSDADAELTCPICFDLIDCAHVTKCGHSFCLTCIQTALEHTHRCPKCNTPCSIVKDIFPNFTLNQIIERFKEESNTKKCKTSQAKTSNLIQYINLAQDELNIDEVNHLLNLLSQKKEELKHTNRKISEMLLYDFLKHLHQVKSDELTRIQNELQVLNEDCKQIEENLSSLHTPLPLDDQAVEQSSGESSQPTTETPTDNAPTTTSNLIETNKKSDSVKFSSVLANKKRIVHKFFDELSNSYIQSHNRDFKELNLIDTTKHSTNSIVLDHIRETVNRITNCNEMRCIASVNNNSDLYSLSSIVSSVDFDKSYEHFAIAGVTKRIKIFDFNTILERPYGIHYPQCEMSHNAKLSCVSWNRYFRQQLACSDYEGVVTLWDSEQCSLIRSYQEHEKRCWGVQYCNVDPRLLASASDDSKVKIWSTNSEYSLLSIDAKSNVCCVVFKPDSKFHVLFGTADHSIHYYDLRNPKEAVSLFKGHRKAVSYVKFNSENYDEFVSASTDSNLKMWKLNEGQCVRSFTGHINEKNFVGLETHNGYIVTGSENNTVYLYCNELSKPLLNHKFDEGINYPKKEEGMNDFVSAVCWSNQNYLLAANSQGIVKILELV